MAMIFGVLSLLIPIGSCANILAILPFPGKSHFVVMEPLLQALAVRGHQLTVYSSFPQKVPLPNFTDVDCSPGRPIYFNNQDYKSLKAFSDRPFKSLFDIVNLSAGDCDLVYKLANFDYIKDKKFDLVIVEMFASDCYVHFSYKLGVPLVSIVTMAPLPWTPDYFGLPDNPSYIPACLIKLQPVMDLYQRMTNTIYVTFSKLVYHFSGSPKYHKIAEDYFQERLPWVEDVAKNSSLLLVNSHFTLSQGRPLPPNVVDVGGIHIKPQQKLPMDLQDLLDNSTEGVILLSFGSMVRVSTLPKDKFKMILSVFSKLPQTVLMKYEEDLPDAPKNVVIRNWLPQRDVLEHKNVKAFISHCGLASIMEAIYCGTPVLGIPVFADQHININTLAWKGAGLSIDLDIMTEEVFSRAVDQVLHNETIINGMKRFSEQFRDRPMSPLQTAVFWTEYVLRHQGAPHLRPASTSLPFYQLWLLDVIAVLLVTLAVVLYVSYRTMKCLISVLNKKYSSNQRIYSKSKKEE